MKTDGPAIYVHARFIFRTECGNETGDKKEREEEEDRGIKRRRTRPVNRIAIRREGIRHAMARRTWVLHLRVSLGTRDTSAFVSRERKFSCFVLQRWTAEFKEMNELKREEESVV